VLAAEGGPVQIGAGCVSMENAVLCGTARHPLFMGDRVLVGPHAQLTGAAVADEVFIAVGAMVLNGAHLGRARPRSPAVAGPDLLRRLRTTACHDRAERRERREVRDRRRGLP
jgi:hypothetical protein